MLGCWERTFQYPDFLGNKKRGSFGPFLLQLNMIGSKYIRVFVDEKNKGLVMQQVDPENGSVETLIDVGQEFELRFALEKWDGLGWIETDKRFVNSQFCPKKEINGR